MHAAALSVDIIASLQSAVYSYSASSALFINLKSFAGTSQMFVVVSDSQESHHAALALISHSIVPLHASVAVSDLLEQLRTFRSAWIGKCPGGGPGVRVRATGDKNAASASSCLSFLRLGFPHLPRLQPSNTT